MRKIKNIIRKIKYYLRKDTIIFLSVLIDKNTFLEENNKIRRRTDIRGSEIGRGTYISEDCIFPRTLIGRFCSIAPRVKVVVGNHPTRDFVSTHPAFFSIKKQAGFTLVNKNKFPEMKLIDNKYFVKIGNDVWLGSDVTIINGVTIGDGAIIGSGSVVSKDIPPYTIWVGNPIVEIRKRFSDEQIKKLLKFKWWNKDMSWLRNNSDKFEHIDKLVKSIK